MDMDAKLFFDPLVLALLVLALAGLGWRFSGFRKRKVRRELARLSALAKQETNPRKRQEMLHRFQEIGGVGESKRIQATRSAVDEGAKARMNGRSRIANPYGLGLWGRARQWRKGWKSVDQNIRWIQSHRG